MTNLGALGSGEMCAQIVVHPPFGPNFPVEFVAFDQIRNVWLALLYNGNNDVISQAYFLDIRKKLKV